MFEAASSSRWSSPPPNFVANTYLTSVSDVDAVTAFSVKVWDPSFSYNVMRYPAVLDATSTSTSLSPSTSAGKTETGSDTTLLILAAVVDAGSAGKGGTGPVASRSFVKRFTRFEPWATAVTSTSPSPSTSMPCAMTGFTMYVCELTAGSPVEMTCRRASLS